MSDTVIRIENVSKRYTLGARTGRDRGLRHLLQDKITAPWRTLARRRTGEGRLGAPDLGQQDFWALRDVSFEIKRGEVVGIIGRNGAGKSTLLKILSRITEPTTGRIEIDGRVASLLEVGTGFHPELTGRENIFLNGAILGMSRSEIRKKLDEIVAFAEVEKFLDTPVKRYSSGMYVRLAFAVAAHLEPEILIVDEVLAVGDVQFQQKCLGKMQSVAGHGRTILFVSHNMAAVTKLCNKGVLLSGGQVKALGRPNKIIEDYLGEDIASDRDTMNLAGRSSTHPFVLHSVEIVSREGRPTSSLPNDQPFYIRITFETLSPIEELRVGFRLHAYDETVVLMSTNCDHLSGVLPTCMPGTHVTVAEVPAHLLNAGRYYLSVGADVPRKCVVLPAVEKVKTFSIEPISGTIVDINSGRPGIVAPLLAWKSA